MEQGRLRSAAGEYTYLRGLFAVPLGALFVLSALGNESWGPLAHTWAFLACVGAVALACLWVNRFYDESYGRVRLSPRQQGRALVATVAVVLVMLVGSLLLHSEAAWSLDLPVDPIPVCFALGMLIFHAATVGLRRHHVVVFGALLVVGALPVWHDPGSLGLVLCGIAVAVSGLLDHRLLVRALGPARGSGDAGA